MFVTLSYYFSYPSSIRRETEGLVDSAKIHSIQVFMHRITMDTHIMVGSIGFMLSIKHFVTCSTCPDEDITITHGPNYENRIQSERT